MSRNWLVGLSFLAALSVPAAQGANLVVHNTGVNSSDVLVSAGAQASFWTLSAEPGGAVETIGSNPFRFFFGSYFADTGSAAWVAPQASGNAGVAGDYTYDLSVDLTGFQPGTAAISGNFGTDNSGSIALNGNAAVATVGNAAFGAPTAFTINSGFTTGVNLIHVTVTNNGDPTAFFVQFTSATATPTVVATPVPPTIWLTLLGLACVGFFLGYSRLKGANLAA
jgi:hypothetical protein